MTIIDRLLMTGIRRLGSPKRGFRYRRADGRRVASADQIRIQGLKIPPAWTSVAITPSRRAAVQAIGRDAAGRWQYLYHQAHVERRERTKQERLVRFIQALPGMRRTVTRDIARPGLPRARVLAGTLRILAACFLRPGSEDYVDQNGSYGIATLRRRHISVVGDRVRFDFVGKAGKRQRREIRDRRLARLMRDLLRYPGEVFKFRKGEDRLVDVRRKHINVYIKEVMGAPFSAKDFRTWAANLLCASALARLAPECEPNHRARKRQVTAAIREVAEHLGNTPAVCRTSYVFDRIIECYEKGRVLKEHIEDVESLTKGKLRVVERTERELLGLLSIKERAS